MKTLAEITRLDYTVEKLPLVTPCGKSSPEFGLYKDNHHLGTVKKGYTVLQNSELLGYVEDAVSRIDTPIDLNQCTSLIYGSGRVAYLYINLGEHIMKANEFSRKTIGDDKINRKLVILNSFDGTTKVSFGTSNVVMSCTNQFHHIFGKISKFKHTTKLHQNVKMMFDHLVKTINAELTLMRIFDKLNEIPIDMEMKDKFIYHTLGIDARYITDEYVEDKRLSTQNVNLIHSLDHSVRKELQSKGTTYWGLFNGATDFYTNKLKLASYENTADKGTDRALDFVVSHGIHNMSMVVKSNIETIKTF